jgi:hypothetical protein
MPLFPHRGRRQADFKKGDLESPHPCIEFNRGDNHEFNKIFTLTFEAVVD